MKKKQTDMGVPPKKCFHGGYDDAITKILKRMTVKLNFGNGIRHSADYNEAPDKPQVIPEGIDIKSFAIVPGKREKIRFIRLMRTWSDGLRIFLV